MNKKLNERNLNDALRTISSIKSRIEDIKWSENKIAELADSLNRINPFRVGDIVRCTGFENKDKFIEVERTYVAGVGGQRKAVTKINPVMPSIFVARGRLINKDNKVGKRIGYATVSIDSVLSGSDDSKQSGQG